MSDRWLRLYESVVNDPKLQRLPGETFKGLINVWCIASANGGRLPPIDDIAFTLRMTEAKAQALIETLIAAGLIDETDDALQPHNWNGRQFKTDVSTERVKRFRNRRKGVSGNGVKPFHETAPETETEQIQSPVPTGTAPAHVSRTVSPDPETDLFRRGREVLGKEAGGLIAKLLKAKGGRINEARSAIEMASGKSDPREYVGAIIRGVANPTEGVVKVGL